MATAVKSEPGQDDKFGGAEGPDAMYVKLVSSDDHEFYVKREYALTSGTIKAMLSGPGYLFWCILAFINSLRFFIATYHIVFYEFEFIS